MWSASLRTLALEEIGGALSWLSSRLAWRCGQREGRGGEAGELAGSHIATPKESGAIGVITGEVVARTSEHPEPASRRLAIG